ncbi:MAG: HAMP domain-containing sensor histidine kinase [Alkalispirochaeta sp.]
MRVGITLRVAASHVILVVAALAVFSGIVVTVTDTELTATGTNVDRATALRLAPWIEDLYLRRHSWSDVDRALRGSAQEGPQHTRRAPMMMDNRGAMVRPGDRAAAPFLQRAVVVVDRSGKILASTFAADPSRDLNVERGVPLGSGTTPDAWVFVGSMISDQDNPIRRAIMQSFLRAGTAAALIILLGAITVSVLWARWVLHPIRNIEAASRAMEDGTYSVIVPVPAGNHELRTLARSFNAMAAEVAQQEETRRRFIADAAHELRTPVSLLSGRIELLRDGVYETTREQWNALHQSVTRIATLVSDLQTIARLDAGRVTLDARSVDPAQMLREVVEEFEPAAHAASITLSIDLPENAQAPGSPMSATTHATAPARLSPVTADPAKLHQILGNLLSNAVRHTPAGGAVVLSATSSADGGIIFAVEDSGPGVPPSERQRIFDRFVRIDSDRGRNHGGSGLGLSITQRLVALHGGTIRAVEPTGVGGGARFEVELPR